MMKDVIRERRKAMKMTQADLASKLYVSEDCIQKWETGKNNIPSDKIPDLCKTLGIDANQLLGIEETNCQPSNDTDLEYINQIIQLGSMPISSDEMIQSYRYIPKEKALYLACAKLLEECPEDSDISYGYIPEITGGFAYTSCGQNLYKLMSMATTKWTPCSNIKLHPRAKVNGKKPSELAIIFENLRVFETERQKCYNVDEIERPQCLWIWDCLYNKIHYSYAPVPKPIPSVERFNVTKFKEKINKTESFQRESNAVAF